MTAKTAGLNGYTVSLPNQRGQVKLGPPNVYAAQPHYDRNNKDLTVRVAGAVMHMMHQHRSPRLAGNVPQSSL